MRLTFRVQHSSLFFKFISWQRKLSDEFWCCNDGKNIGQEEEEVKKKKEKEKEEKKKEGEEETEKKKKKKKKKRMDMNWKVITSIIANENCVKKTH